MEIDFPREIYLAGHSARLEWVFRPRDDRILGERRTQEFSLPLVSQNQGCLPAIDRPKCIINRVLITRSLSEEPKHAVNIAQEEIRHWRDRTS